MNKAFLGAYRKGYKAGITGLPRVAPYRDKRTTYNNGVTFSMAFIHYWEDGYDEAAKDRIALKEASQEAI